MNAARFVLGCLMYWALMVSPAPARAADQYFFALLAGQHENDDPRTFALFIKTTDGAGTEQELLASPSLVSGRIRGSAPRQLDAEMPLAEFLAWARQTHVRLTMWGPYPIEQELYERSPTRIGRRQFTMSEQQVEKELARAGGTSKYLDAVADMEKGRQNLPNAGDATCLLIVHGLKPWFLPPGHAPDWLLERLQLDKHGVTRMAR